ncbi:rho GTPase-activating protein gacF-like isoform X2 [Contarinia nasturtii]|uniref:rho GTPase-activating protein gacF-like isoform X2 n=1 Tax=Contarinia nasturtii TaxID=265458 RepID=UPI0012D3A6E0|nr:rho GTPase-activating protein gacF-like isoform X2 [Contarinia nasturtii]
MMKIQFFKKKWLTDFRQMSHMKIEADAVPPNVVIKTEDEDEDMDDQMTDSPPDLHVEEPIEPEPERSVAEPVQASTSRKSMQESNRDEDRNEFRSVAPEQNVRQKDADEVQSERDSKDARNKKHERHSIQKKTDETDAPQSSTSAIGGRIKDRRKTMVSLERPSTPTVITAVRKRRLSVVESRSSENVDKNRNQSQKVDDIEANRAKKMKISDGIKEKSLTTTTVAETPVKPKSSINQLTSTPIASSSLSSSNKSIQSKLLHRDKKVKSTATPPITQFFQNTQKSPVFRCETCVVILKSQNEVNFHSRTHKKGRCIKCKKTIDNNCIGSIHKHMISCLYLGNKLPKERLARFLKCKLGITRLTAEKIEKIQKELSSTRKRTSKKPAPKSKQRETHEKDAKTKGTSQTDEKSMEKNSLSMDTTKIDAEKRMDTSIKSVNDQVNDDKNGKKSKSKKTPSKAKTAEKETNEEFVILGNQSAALNWIDEQMKDKPFVLRNFETEKPTYISINKNDQPAMNKATKEKIAYFIESIKVRKDQLCTPQKSRPMNLLTSSVRGNNRNSPNVPTNVPIQSQLPSSLTKSPSNVHAPQINHAQALSGPSRITPPSPNIAIAQTASTPNAISSSNTVNANTQNPSNTPTLPQLLTIPTRVPAPRSRALSVHMSQAEHSSNARLPSRRQSVCDKQTGLKSNPPSRNAQCPPRESYQQQQRATPPQLHLPYITHIHNTDFLQNPVNRASEAPLERTEKEIRTPQSTLKILTPDDLNSRAMHVSQIVPVTQNPRIDSPNSTENNTNANNSNDIKRVPSTKRPRTKTTPLRSQSQAPPPLPTISDGADISLSVSLSKVGNMAELLITLNEVRLDYDFLSTKRQNEIKSSLLKGNMWRKMLDLLKTITPTHEAVHLFQKILPESKFDIFINELKQVYGSRFFKI